MSCNINKDAEKTVSTADSRSRDKGSAAVELAILLPVYIILFLAAYYIGNGLLAGQKLRSCARTYAESPVHGYLASYVQQFFDNHRHESGMYQLQMTNYSSLDLDPYEGWGGGDVFDAEYVEEMTTLPIEDLAGNISIILEGNPRDDSIRGYSIGSGTWRSGCSAKSLSAMMEYDTTGVQPEDRGISDFYWQWYRASGKYSYTEGGGAGLGLTISEIEIYRHAMEANLGQFFPSPGPGGGRMPNSMFRRLETSDSVISPKYNGPYYPDYGPYIEP